MKRGAKAAPRKEARRKQLDKNTTFTITNDTIEIGYLFDRVREFCEDHRLPIKTVFDLCLVVEEMLSYVISSGFDEGQRASIQVRLSIEKDQALITVDYQGRALNPLEAPKIDITMPIEDLPLEGWDIHLLHLLADDIGYQRSGEKNIITVVKKWEVMDEATSR
jgi:anti-sigma regulatory factor (Ser/Thr protein kinase)